MSQQRSILSFFRPTAKRPAGDDADDFAEPAAKRAPAPVSPPAKKPVATSPKASDKKDESGSAKKKGKNKSKKEKEKIAPPAAADGVEPPVSAAKAKKNKKESKKDEGSVSSKSAKSNKKEKDDNASEKGSKKKSSSKKEKDDGSDKSASLKSKKEEGSAKSEKESKKKKKKKKSKKGTDDGEESKKEKKPKKDKEDGKEGAKKSKSPAAKSKKEEAPNKSKEESPGKPAGKKAKKSADDKAVVASPMAPVLEKKSNTKGKDGSANANELPIEDSSELPGNDDGSSLSRQARRKKKAAPAAVPSTPTSKPTTPLKSTLTSSPSLISPPASATIATSPVPVSMPAPVAAPYTGASPSLLSQVGDVKDKEKEVMKKKQTLVEDIEEVLDVSDGCGTESDEDLKRYRPLPAKPVSHTSPVSVSKSTPTSSASPTPSGAPAGAAASAQISVGNKKAFFRGGGFGGHSVTPPNRGKKAVPQGNEHSLFGLTFTFTGVLDSLEREEAGALVEQYGGKVMKTAGKTLNYLVAGLEAGESKLRKATEAGTKVIDEDQLFEMIRTRPGQRLTKAQLAKLPKREDPTQVEAAVPVNTPLVSVPITVPPGSPLRPKPLASPSPSPALSAKPAVKTTAPNLNAPPAIESMLWVDKYAPQRTEDVLGNGASVQKLEQWLRNWRPGNGKRAALVTGPPGIGKSSSAHLVAHKLKYHPLETNASDARSRAALLALASATTSTSLHKFFGARDPVAAAQHDQEKHVVLIMDEVDGMSGNADRGGMKELIAVIDRSGVPIICIANDARATKIKSLANHCEEFKYRRPTLADMEKRAIAVAKAENIPDLEFPRIRSMVAQCNGDMRQALNMLQTAYPPAKLGRARFSESTGRKEVSDTNVFELVPMMFRYPESASMDERIDAYFIDDMLVPLMVWECYPSTQRANSAALRDLAAAADSASESDLFNREIRKNQLFTLSPAHAVMSTVRPCYLVRGGGVAPRFPALLGKMSATNKRYRLLKELQAHMSRQVSANKLEVGLDYLRLLHGALTRPLIEQEVGGVPEVLDTMEEYGLTREDWTTVAELAEWSTSNFTAIPTQAKTQLTNQYKKRHDLKHGISRARNSKAPNVLFDDRGEDEDGEDGAGGEEANNASQEGSEGEEVDLTNDKFVKRVANNAKTKKAAAKRKNRSE